MVYNYLGMKLMYINKQNKILFAAMDRDRSGTIDFDEFLVAIRVMKITIK